MYPAVLGLITIVIGVEGCVGYFYGANVFLDKVLFPASGPKAGRNINRANMIRPWIFLGPAILALGLYCGRDVHFEFSRKTPRQCARLCRVRKLQQNVCRTQVRRSHVQQRVVADCGPRRRDAFWPCGSPTDGPPQWG